MSKERSLGTPCGDLVTGVETHFWWPDLHGDVREVFRVVKPGGTLVLIAEVYGGSKAKTGQLAEKYASRTGMKLLSGGGASQASGRGGLLGCSGY
jgi:ubiquinone/menaquinone biosynthesis C-methylase UbiE